MCNLPALHCVGVYPTTKREKKRCVEPVKMTYVVLRAEGVNEVWPDVYMLITTSSLPCGDVFLFFFTAFFFPFYSTYCETGGERSWPCDKSRLKGLLLLLFFFSFCEKHLHP